MTSSPTSWTANDKHIYVTKNYNSNGDFRKNKGQTQDFKESSNKTNVDLLPKDKIQTSIKYNDGTLSIKNFIDWCKENKIKVIAGYPPIIDTAPLEPDHSEFLLEISQFYKDNDIEVIGTPYDFRYPASYFYNSRYHLNNEGRFIHTRKLIPDLKKALRKLGYIPTQQNDPKAS
jgi:hypothetical protein